MRILITGGQGQLAKDLALHCGQTGDDVVSLSRSELDITDALAVDQAVTNARPDAVINCAAWTAVDACEADVDRAHLVNGHAVGFLARAATDVGAHLVQISTDYVFDGSKTGSYHEDDVTNPQSVYGASKLAGEVAAGPDATIVRTSWVFSAHGGNMVETVLRLAASHPELRFVSDQRGAPTCTADLAIALRALAQDRHAGTLHVTNAGVVSWFEFAQAVLACAGQDPARVHPITTAELSPPRPAPRPANSALSNDRFTSLGYEPLQDFRDVLGEIVSCYTQPS